LKRRTQGREKGKKDELCPDNLKKVYKTRKSKFGKRQKYDMNCREK
jgi:hypothetical protein